jgi:ABC-type Co2+ transport system permease subunit
MHIEPGVVDGAKLMLSYATGIMSLGLAAKMGADTVRNDGGFLALVARSGVATALVFSFFELLPHYPVGVSEVHLILGSTLFLMLGAGPAAIGLALGLLVQGLFFAPSDLPQYGMNVTTLVVPIWALAHLARSVISPKTAYVDTGYRKALALSVAYQGGIIAWVAFWALYGRGASAENLVAVTRFGTAYFAVVALEPLIDVAVLAFAKNFRWLTANRMFAHRLHAASA